VRNSAGLTVQKSRRRQQPYCLSLWFIVQLSPQSIIIMKDQLFQVIVWRRNVGRPSDKRKDQRPWIRNKSEMTYTVLVTVAEVVGVLTMMISRDADRWVISWAWHHAKHCPETSVKWVSKTTKG
jgi:hypothetical protein